MMLSVDGCIKSVKIYKNLEKLSNKKSWLFMTRKIDRLINESAFVSFYIFLHFLYIHLHLTSLIKPLTVLMMVQHNRNAIVSTDFVSL